MPAKYTWDAAYAAWNTRADIQPEIDRRVAEERAKLLERLRVPSEGMIDAAWANAADDCGGFDYIEPKEGWQAMLAQFEKEQQP